MEIHATTRADVNGKRGVATDFHMTNPGDSATSAPLPPRISVNRPCALAHLAPALNTGRGDLYLNDAFVASDGTTHARGNEQELLEWLVPPNSLKHQDAWFLRDGMHLRNNATFLTKFLYRVPASDKRAIVIHVHETAGAEPVI